MPGIVGRDFFQDIESVHRDYVTAHPGLGAAVTLDRLASAGAGLTTQSVKSNLNSLGPLAVTVALKGNFRRLPYFSGITDCCLA